MTEAAPTLDTAECVLFLQFWMEVTDAPHVTLVSIVPDGKTETSTFGRGDLDAAKSWVAERQGAGCNIYFEPNETRPGCNNKPAKTDMMAALGRFGDIDPLDDQFPLADERDRLARLVANLAADPNFPPTAIIDTGNGMQPLWTVAREVLSPKAIARIENETKAIENALGAGGTHNIDRLLRLPGTLNFPNKKKRNLGRGVSRARLIFSAPNLCTADQAAGLGAHLSARLAGTGLVRAKPTKADKRTAGQARDDEVAALVAELEVAGAGKIMREERLPADLQARLTTALAARKRLGDRWAGLVDDLIEAGKDSSRSGVDLSVAAMLKFAGFSHVDAGLILCAFRHGKTNCDDWSDGTMRLRHVARCVLHSHKPAATETQVTDWPQPLDFLVDQDAAPPDLHPEHIPDALCPFVMDTSARMGVDPISVALGGLVSCAAVMSDEWRVQPKRLDYTWTENPRLWGAIVGDPSILKSPVIAACTRPIDKLDAIARENHQRAMRIYWANLARWKRDKPDTPAPIPPKLPRYMIEGATVEAISEVLRDDNESRQFAPAGKVLSRHDEMSEFFGNLDRYRAGGKGSADRGAYLRLYNGGRYTIDRIGRGSFAISNWSACYLGGIQPEPIQRIANEAADDGLLQRFMYCVPGPQQAGLDRAPNHDAIKRYETLFPALAALHPPKSLGGDKTRSATLHHDAHRHREDVDALARAMAALPDTSPRLKAAFGKWPGLFARLCLTFHLIDLADATLNGGMSLNPQIIPALTARRVADFMQDIVLPHLLRADAVMFSTAQTGHARWIAGHILAQKLERITTRDVVRAYGALRAPECKVELADVMASLVTVSWLEPEVPSNPMKPVWAWTVNPAVHSLFADKAARERVLREKARADIAADIEVLRRKRR